MQNISPVLPDTEGGGMKLTKRWLENNNACSEAVEWFLAQEKKDYKSLLELCIKEDRFDWANWVISQKLPKINKVRYAVYAAEQVIGIYEKQYPDDKRPREAIRADNRYIKNQNKKFYL